MFGELSTFCVERVMMDFPLASGMPDAAGCKPFLLPDAAGCKPNPLPYAAGCNLCQNVRHLRTVTDLAPYPAATAHRLTIKKGGATRQSTRGSVRVMHISVAGCSRMQVSPFAGCCRM